MRNSGATRLENCPPTSTTRGTGISVSRASCQLMQNSMTATLTTMSTLLTRSGRAWATRISICRVSLIIRLISSPVCLS